MAAKKPAKTESPEDAKPAKMGRPSLYSEEMAASICDRIACGDSLASICREEGMPDYKTVIRWLREKDDFRDNYTRAREDQADADADSVQDIGRRVLTGELDPQAARVAIDALKWAAGKRKPKKYGDKLDLNHSGGIAVSSTDLTDDQLAAIAAGRGG